MNPEKPSFDNKSEWLKHHAKELALTMGETIIGTVTVGAIMTALGYDTSHLPELGMMYVVARQANKAFSK